ncbi:hypothetical protein EF405_06335 [Cyclobacteriaceae bacterium YHN15]|nr:hypothetical protein EF405_06335 [Cyclobacteriaceae bacterium YHN15]
MGFSRQIKNQFVQKAILGLLLVATAFHMGMAHIYPDSKKAKEALANSEDDEKKKSKGEMINGFNSQKSCQPSNF